MSDYTPILPTRHRNLMQWTQPVIFLRKALRVYPNEIKPLLWVTDDFWLLLKNSPTVSMNLCKVLSQQIRNFQNRLKSVEIKG
jgi:hypothetical protein